MVKSKYKIVSRDKYSKRTRYNFLRYLTFLKEISECNYNREILQ